MKHLLTVFFTLIAALTFSQNQVTGTVTDENGEGLPGVTVRVADTSLGAITGIDGEYSLDNIPDGEQTLIFSYVGYNTARIPVNGQSVINTTLQLDVTSIQEVVVTGFYELPIDRATGSFSTLGEEELGKIVTPNLIDKLDGQLSGLDVRDGKIFIRGQNTFNTGQLDYEQIDNPAIPSPTGVLLADGSEFSYRTDPSQPLIVLDGFPYQGDINDINPNDIESINVLKDAASASIWGTKASNGVIVITRKKAARKGTKVSFSSYATMNDQPGFDDYGYVQPHEAFDFERYVLDSLGGRNSTNEFFGNSALQDIYYKRDFTGEITYPEAERMIQDLKRQSHYTRAQDAFLQKQFTQNYSIEIAHNAGKLSNIITADFNNNRPSFIGNKNNRLNVSLRGNYEIADWFDIDYSYTNKFSSGENNSLAGIFTAGNLRPYEKLMDANGNYLPMSLTRGRRFLNSSGFVGEGVSAQTASYRTRDEYRALGYLPWHWNALEEQNNNDITNTGRLDIMQVQANLKLPKGFRFSSQLQYQPERNEKDIYYNERSYFARNEVNFYTSTQLVSGRQSFNYGIPLGKGYNQSVNTNTTGLNFRNTLFFDKLFDDIHDISVQAGTDFSQVDTDYKTRTLYGYDPVSGNHGNALINFRDLILDFNEESGDYTFNGTPRRLSSFANHDGFNKQRDLGLFAVLGYDYNSRYNITASGRVDKSNLTINSAGNNFNWSVGAGWTISNENFFQPLSEVFKLARLRSSFGYTGNVDRSAVDFLFGIPNYNPSWNLDHLVVPNGSNPRLKMERTRNFNAGLDLHTATNRGRLIFDIYNNLSSDLIVNQRTDPTFKGFTSGRLNNGEISNTGIDFKLDYDIIQKQDFVWNSVLNFGHNKSEVKKYSIDESPRFYRLLLNGAAKVPGYEVNSIFSYDFAGIDANGNPTININDQPISTNVQDDGGNGVYGYNIIKLTDLVHGGTLVPKNYGGWFNTLKYKNVQLSFNINYELGHKMRMPYSSIYFEDYLNKIPRKDIFENFGQKNYKSGSNIPRLISSNYRNDPYYTTLFENSNHQQWATYASNRIINADNIRLRYVNASYELPKEFIAKTGIGLSNLTLSFQADNLLVWNNNDYNIDPQYPYQPNPRSYTISLRGSF